MLNVVINSVQDICGDIIHKCLDFAGAAMPGMV